MLFWRILPLTQKLVPIEQLKIYWLARLVWLMLAAMLIALSSTWLPFFQIVYCMLMLGLLVFPDAYLLFAKTIEINQLEDFFTLYGWLWVVWIRYVVIGISFLILGFFLIELLIRAGEISHPHIYWFAIYFLGWLVAYDYQLIFAYLPLAKKSI